MNKIILFISRNLTSFKRNTISLGESKIQMGTSKTAGHPVRVGLKRIRKLDRNPIRLSIKKTSPLKLSNNIILGQPQINETAYIAMPGFTVPDPQRAKFVIGTLIFPS